MMINIRTFGVNGSTNIRTFVVNMSIEIRNKEYI